MYGIRDRDLVKTFERTGGLIVWHELYGIRPPAELGAPLVQWIAPSGNGIFVYCSPDLRKRLLAP
jgi:hypothetical protein